MNRLAKTMCQVWLSITLKTTGSALDKNNMESPGPDQFQSQADPETSNLRYRVMCGLASLFNGNRVSFDIDPGPDSCLSQGNPENGKLRFRARCG